MTTKEDFKKTVEDYSSKEWYQKPLAFWLGISEVSSKGDRLDARFPKVNFRENFWTAAIIAKEVWHLNWTNSYPVNWDWLLWILEHFEPFFDDKEKHENIEVIKSLVKVSLQTNKQISATFLSEDTPPIVDIWDAYLRLYLLSLRHVLPNTINLDGIFNTLPNVAWTNIWPVALDEINEVRMKMVLAWQNLEVYSQDMFPAMLDYVNPIRVRIMNSRNVSLWAYLSPWTTVMAAWAVNFNAWTLWKCMVEWRISQWVIVDEGSDIWGWASTQWTLSWGWKTKIRIGKHCLLGANSGIWISIWDYCTVDAWLYVTDWTKVTFTDKSWQISIVKASELSWMDNIFFRRDSISWQVTAEVRSNKIKLNPMLHK